MLYCGPGHIVCLAMLWEHLNIDILTEDHWRIGAISMLKGS